MSMSLSRRESLKWMFSAVAIPLLPVSTLAKTDQSLTMLYTCRFPRAFSSLKEVYEFYDPSLEQHDRIAENLVSVFKGEGKVLRAHSRLEGNTYFYEVTFTSRERGEEFLDAYNQSTGNIQSQAKRDYDFSESVDWRRGGEQA